MSPSEPDVKLKIRALFGQRKQNAVQITALRFMNYSELTWAIIAGEYFPFVFTRRVNRACDRVIIAHQLFVCTLHTQQGWSTVEFFLNKLIIWGAAFSLARTFLIIFFYLFHFSDYSLHNSWWRIFVFQFKLTVVTHLKSFPISCYHYNIWILK